MNLQSRSKEEPEVNLTSLIDVVLLLLVFFMVSTSFVKETEIGIRLPEATSDSEPDPVVDVLEISITETGTFAVNGRSLLNNERRTLRLAIERLIGDKRDMPVLIRADAQSLHQDTVTAMSVAGDLGFVEINIATVTAPDAR
jgi:biopolymer transport protein ExbD